MCSNNPHFLEVDCGCRALGVEELPCTIYVANDVFCYATYLNQLFKLWRNRLVADHLFFHVGGCVANHADTISRCVANHA